MVGGIIGAGPTQWGLGGSVEASPRQSNGTMLE